MAAPPYPHSTTSPKHCVHTWWQSVTKTHTHAHSVQRKQQQPHNDPALSQHNQAFSVWHSLCFSLTHAHTHTSLSLIPEFKKTNHFHLPPTILFSQFSEALFPFFPLAACKKWLFSRSSLSQWLATFSFFWNLKVILPSFCEQHATSKVQRVTRISWGWKNISHSVQRKNPSPHFIFTQL